MNLCTFRQSFENENESEKESSDKVQLLSLTIMTVIITTTTTLTSTTTTYTNAKSSYISAKSFLYAHLNSALVSVTLEDVNEFSPEFERQLYSLTLDLDPKHVKLHDLLEKENTSKQQRGEEGENEEEILLQVQAKDQDCSTEFGSICRYELLAEPQHWTSQQQQQQQLQQQQQTNLEYNPDLMSALSVDSSGRVKIKRHFLEKAASTGSFLGNSWNLDANVNQQQQQQQQTKDDSTSRTSPSSPSSSSSSSSSLFSFQVIAYDCGDKKSLAPATIHLHLNKLCRPKLKGKSLPLNFVADDR